MTKALRDESIDVAILLTEGIVADLHRGNPSKSVGTYVGTPLTWGVHVPAGSPVRDVEGLRADGAPARYAVSRMGSGSHLMAVVDARSRGWEPATALEVEIGGGLDGCRAAFRDGGAAAQRLAFMWEKFTTKPYVDGGEFARIGECVTPWPCFLVAASDAALAFKGDRCRRPAWCARRRRGSAERRPGRRHLEDVRPRRGRRRRVARHRRVGVGAAVSHAMLGA